MRPALALSYHGVADIPPRQDRALLFVRPQDLLRHVRLLRRWSYRFVTFGELARRAADGAAVGLVALTFDDGLVDNATTLVPLLRFAGVPATVFAVSGWLGQSHPDAPWTRAMSISELRAISAAGIEIGGHSTQHGDLTRMQRDRAEADMRDCRTTLESIVDRAVEVFAYPYGYATQETSAACRAAGYRAACRTSGVGSWNDPFNLPRQAMANRASSLGLWLKRDNRYEPLMQTVAGRATRRAIRALRMLS